MDLKQQRGEVIDSAVNVETGIDTIISQHYLGKVSFAFMFEFLSDEACPFALKVNVLGKIRPDLGKPFLEQLRRFSSIRNHFAHRGKGYSSAADTDQTFRYPDPKDPTKSLDFDAEFEQFNGLNKTILDALFKEIEAMGIHSIGPDDAKPVT
jgi:hypothetical protein